TYPAFIEDAADAVAHVMAHIYLHCTPTKFYVGGHSAGCYLSMMLAFDRHYLAARGIDAGTLGGYALISGGTTKHFSLLAAAGEDKRLLRIDDTCVLWHLRADGAPLFVVSSDVDMPTRREQNLLFVSALRHLDYASPIEYHEYPGVGHRYFVRRDERTGEIPVAADLLAFLRRCEKL
ncbi:MAG: alpha/beta hydrolase fold domain-containing protein, partial [Clostridia bacterium]|nr:alpha/beta hydrolase fold domain-containing protein [Clostridia bacterium]